MISLKWSGYGGQSKNLKTGLTIIIKGAAGLTVLANQQTPVDYEPALM